MGYIYLLLLKTPLAMLKTIAAKNCGTIAGGAKNSVRINFLRTVISLVIGVILWLFVRDTTGPEGTFYAALNGVSNGLFLFVWILSTQYVSLCLVEVFCMLGAVVVTLLITPLLLPGETVSILQWIGCGCLVAASILFQKGDGENRISIKSVLLLFICMFASTGCSISKKLYVTNTGSSIQVYNLIAFFVSAVTLVIIYIVLALGKKNTKEETPDMHMGSLLKNKRVMFYIFIASATLYGAEFFMTKASALLPSAILYPLSYGCSMAYNFIADTFIYREKVTIRRVFAVVLTLISIVLINV